MPEHNFELTISGALTDDRLDVLVAAGCDDATFSTKGDLTFADVGREAPTMLDAVVSAIGAVETVDGLEVLHVDPDERWAPSSTLAPSPRTRACAKGIALP